MGWLVILFFHPLVSRDEAGIHVSYSCNYVVKMMQVLFSYHTNKIFPHFPIMHMTYLHVLCVGTKDKNPIMYEASFNSAQLTLSS